MVVDLGWPGQLHHDGVVAERRRQLLQPAPERPALVRARKLHGGSSRSDEGEPLGGRQPQRFREQPRHTDNHHVVVDEEVDQLIDERRKPAHRGQLEIGSDVVGRHSEPLRDLGQRHLAPLHQPRQHHEEPLEALFGGTPHATPR